MDPGANDGVGQGERPGGRCRGRGDGSELRDGNAGDTWDPEAPARGVTEPGRPAGWVRAAGAARPGAARWRRRPAERAAGPSARASLRDGRHGWAAAGRRTHPTSPNPPPRPASGSSICAGTGPRASKGPAPGVMLCYHRLEILRDV